MTQGGAGGNPKPNIRVHEFIYTKPYKGEIVVFCYILTLSCLSKKLELHETFLEIENPWLTNAEDRSVAQEVGIHTRVDSGPAPSPGKFRQPVPEAPSSGDSSQTFSMSSVECLHITSPLSSSISETKCAQSANINCLLCALKGIGTLAY